MSTGKNQQQNNILAHIENLAGTVRYHSAAIDSKTLLDKETGTITLFAFSEGQQLSENKSPFDVMVSIVDGEAEITVSGKSFTLKAGEMITVPAKNTYSLKAVKRFKVLMVMVK